MDTTSATSRSPWPRWLGYGGLLPFVAGALARWMLTDPLDVAFVAFALAAYAATIASFLGGVHWGPALRAGGTTLAPLLWGVVPQLLGWSALLMPTRVGLFMCAAVLAICYVADCYLYPAEGLGAWLPLRLRLTVVAVASCLVAAVA